MLILCRRNFFGNELFPAALLLPFPQAALVSGDWIAFFSLLLPASAEQGIQTRKSNAHPRSPLYASDFFGNELFSAALFLPFCCPFAALSQAALASGSQFD